MTEENDTLEVYPLIHPSNEMLTIVLSIQCAIGIPGNVAFIILFLSEYKKRKPHEWLLFLIALSDLFFCLEVAFMETYFLLHPLSLGCKISGVLNYVLGMQSDLEPALVAFNRYLALYNSQKCAHIFTKKNIFILWFLTLIFLTTLTIPFIATDNLGQDDLGICGIRDPTLFLKIVDLMFLVSDVITTSFCFYCAYKIVKKLRQHKINTQASISSKLHADSTEIVVLVLVVTITPLLTQAPALVVKQFNAFLPGFINPWVSRLSTAFFPLTSTINPFVTMYVVRDYRKAVRSFLGRFGSNGVVTTSAAQQIPPQIGVRNSQNIVSVPPQ